MTMTTKQSPGRAFTLAAAGAGILLLLAIAVLILAFAPGDSTEAMRTIGTIAMAVAGVTGAGSAGIAGRDAMTGGLTSSNADRVILDRQLQRVPPPGPG